MYVCIYIYTYICTHICVCICIYIYIYICTYICIRIHESRQRQRILINMPCTQKDTPIFVRAYTYRNIHTCIHTYAHAYNRTHIHTYKQTYIHTYLNTYLLTYMYTQHMYVHTYIHVSCYKNGPNSQHHTHHLQEYELMEHYVFNQRLELTHKLPAVESSLASDDSKKSLSLSLSLALSSSRTPFLFSSSFSSSVVFCL